MSDGSDLMGLLKWRQGPCISRGFLLCGSEVNFLSNVFSFVDRKADGLGDG